MRADPPRVRAGEVVAVLGGEREAVEDLQARRLDFARARAHGLLELVGALGQRLLVAAGGEQVAHAQLGLDGVERLGEEVAGAERRARGAAPRA